MKKYKHLNRQQRYTISAMYKSGFSKTVIARMTGVSVSTISREISRNSGKRGYSHTQAQKFADERKAYVRNNSSISGYVREKAVSYLVEEQWSPEQISGYMGTQGLKISHETIYAIIREDRRNGGTLYKHCRNRGKYRKRPVGGHMPIKDRVSIHDRPGEADGTRFGDLEMDLIIGRNNKGAILTITDRLTNFVWMRKLEYGKNPEKLAEAVYRDLFPYHRIIKTITTDHGPEFSRHLLITKLLKGVPVYFADPYSSWQKGAIENANKLIRQYIPKHTDFNTITDEYVKMVQYKLNNRPRKKLNYISPKAAFFKCVDEFCT